MRVRTPFPLLRSLSGKYPWEKYEPPYPPSYGLNSTTTVLLGEWLLHWITYKGWYAIKQRNQTIRNSKSIDHFGPRGKKSWKNSIVFLLPRLLLHVLILSCQTFQWGSNRHFLERKLFAHSSDCTEAYQKCFLNFPTLNKSNLYVVLTNSSSNCRLSKFYVSGSI